MRFNTCLKTSTTPHVDGWGHEAPKVLPTKGGQSQNESFGYPPCLLPDVGIEGLTHRGGQETGIRLCLVLLSVRESHGPATYLGCIIIDGQQRSDQWGSDVVLVDAWW